MAAVECAIVVVDGMSAIAAVFKNISDAFTGGFKQDGLIRVFAGTKEVQVHSCNYLKFCVCSARTNTWDIEIAGGKIFH